ncbi:Homeobox-leucine zipper protein [Quillaja saponaria]|uniref:Homeobox-leucine zipper protein n=1 Tax=Quillaja saponaria TaxID=32244 RepID=A0AAD7LUA0_QUISA|nr:Homeobox-leucine zipper protein [Quillaja saponaria]
MDLGSGGGSGDEHDSSNSYERKLHHRHTPHQIQQLETFFKECQHPNKNQRIQLGMELGLDPKRIKFWFQNKRTQIKAHTERTDNNGLRAEIEIIMSENLSIIEALKNVTCSSCGGSTIEEEECQHTLQKLQKENAQLKEEHEKVSILIAKYIGKPISQLELIVSAPGSPLDLSPGTSSNQGVTSPTIDQDLHLASILSTDNVLECQLTVVTDMEKELMREIAASAMEELITLLGNKSSKESGIVIMSGMQLVNRFLDSNEWVDIFPTIVTKSKTIHVLETGSSGNRTGALQLMYEQMHILSPLVPPREFYFLRYCQQVEPVTWVIVDMSYDFLQENTPPSCFWRLPSGCMIHEMPNGSTKVTWVEHVEVDDETQTHRLYRDLVCSSMGYGAQRWVYTLQRMAERFAYSIGDSLPSHDPGGVLRSHEAKMSIMKLGHRMVKNFCGILSMSGMFDLSEKSEVNTSEIWVSVYKNTEPGQPGGTVVIAASSIWLPLPPWYVFEFLKDEKKRVQWDVLSYENPVHEILRISYGTHPRNCISVTQPFVPYENSMRIFQETCADPLESLVIYAPINLTDLDILMSGEDSSSIPILPSGIIITGDSRVNSGTEVSTSMSAARLHGSLLTVAFQILISSHLSTKHLNLEVTTIKTLLNSTVKNIKHALNCSSF